MLALTQGTASSRTRKSETFFNPPWNAVLREPLECDAGTLHQALRTALVARRGHHGVAPKRWLDSKFAPSSTILDAAISLYGQHDVSAIAAHAAPVELIDQCTEEVAGWITRSQEEKQSRILFVSGAPAPVRPW